MGDSSAGKFGSTSVNAIIPREWGDTLSLFSMSVGLTNILGYQWNYWKKSYNHPWKFSVSNIEILNQKSNTIHTQSVFFQTTYRRLLIFLDALLYSRYFLLLDTGKPLSVGSIMVFRSNLKLVPFRDTGVKSVMLLLYYPRQVTSPCFQRSFLYHCTRNSCQTSTNPHQS